MCDGMNASPRWLNEPAVPGNRLCPAFGEFPLFVFERTTQKFASPQAARKAHRLPEKLKCCE